MSYLRAFVVAVVIFLGLSRPAAAAPAWMQPGKAGPFMFNLQIGPAINAKDTINMGALVLDFGFAVDAKKNAYLLFPLQFQFAQVNVPFGNGFTAGIVMVPLGFQYDIAIPPVPGLYISPRFVAGYAAFTSSCNGPGCATQNAGFLAPEVTLKMVFGRRWNAGLVPFSLPVFITSTNGNTFTSISYRILFFGGVNF